MGLYSDWIDWLMSTWRMWAAFIWVGTFVALVGADGVFGFLGSPAGPHWRWLAFLIFAAGIIAVMVGLILGVGAIGRAIGGKAFVAETSRISAPISAEERSLPKQLSDIQSALFEKSSTYTKLIFGLAYGGFFAFWSGTRQYLSGDVVVTSALLVLVSLGLFICFELLNAAILSHIAISFSRSLTLDELPVAIERFQRRSARLARALAFAWYPVFFVSLVSGLGGGGILAFGWVRWLLVSK
ncbi:MAG: hypothetical protein ACRD5K_05900 [Candidatus Acidiferrales bacterium]